MCTLALVQRLMYYYDNYNGVLPWFACLFVCKSFGFFLLPKGFVLSRHRGRPHLRSPLLSACLCVRMRVNNIVTISHSLSLTLSLSVVSLSLHGRLC